MPRASWCGGDGTGWGPEELLPGCDWVGDCWRRRGDALGNRLLRPPGPRQRMEKWRTFSLAPHHVDLRILILNYRLRFHGFKGALHPASQPERGLTLVPRDRSPRRPRDDEPGGLCSTPGAPCPSPRPEPRAGRTLSCT